MFHYVLKNFKYYHFDLDLFEIRLKELLEKYRVISLSDFNHLITNNHDMNNCVMLTFDDATIDHYKYVYPILKKYNCSGLFFVASNVFNNSILNIQYIHRLLSLNCFDQIYDDFIQKLQENNVIVDDINIKDKIVYFKQNLQFKLEKKIRNKILNYLVDKYKVSKDFENYYITKEQLKEMKENGMFIGLHTENHLNLSLLSYKQQKQEVFDNLKKLKLFKLIDDDLISIAYPFGYYDDDTLKIMRELGVKFGFKANTFGPLGDLEINRIDCNELK